MRGRGLVFAEKLTVLPATFRSVLGRDDFFGTFRVDFSEWTEDPPSFDVLLRRASLMSGSETRQEASK
jgi:hypothetical protein